VSGRRLPNWLDAYMEYTENTESSPSFHCWVAYSMIAAALRKKTCLQLGRLRIYPNLYVVLVAEPGIARKSQAISYGVDILNEIPAICLSADAITKEAMLQDLEQGAVDEPMPDQTIFRHASLSIISKEFESFLGQRGENTKMLVLLTDLFDAQEIPFRYRTKNSGNTTVPSVYLNILGATTPDSLASSLPTSAIGGGLTSRIIFVWSAIKSKKVPVPELTPRVKQLKIDLVHDLSIISRIAGAYSFSPAAMAYWVDWYTNYDETSPFRTCKDPAFNGWYSRKPLFAQKLAMIMAAAETNSRVLDVKYFERAIIAVEDAERTMGKTFTAIGKSDVASEVASVMDIVKRYNVIGEKQLMQMVWRDIDSNKFDNVMGTVTKTGLVVRSFKGPDGAQGIHYYWKGDEK
jgi:hypothetical protein